MIVYKKSLPPVLKSQYCLASTMLSKLKSVKALVFYAILFASSPIIAQSFFIINADNIIANNSNIIKYSDRTNSDIPLNKNIEFSETYTMVNDGGYGVSAEIGKQVQNSQITISGELLGQYQSEQSEKDKNVRLNSRISGIALNAYISKKTTMAISPFVNFGLGFASLDVFGVYVIKNVNQPTELAFGSYNTERFNTKNMKLLYKVSVGVGIKLSQAGSIGFYYKFLATDTLISLNGIKNDTTSKIKKFDADTLKVNNIRYSSHSIGISFIYNLDANYS